MDAAAFFSQPGRWDYSYAAGVRSLPLGLSAWGELGYNHLLWGDSPSASNPFYGYVRPKVSLQSSGIVNRADVGIDLAFWAPLVFEVTYAWDHRSGDFSEFDCAQLQCRGLVRRAKVAAKLSAGYGDYFLLWDSLMEQVKAPLSVTQDVGDQYWSLRAASAQDLMLSTELTLGRKLSDQWSAGVVGARSRFQNTGENSTSAMAFASFKRASLRYFIGAGMYESSRSERGLATAFGLKWVGGESFSIR